MDKVSHDICLSSWPLWSLLGMTPYHVWVPAYGHKSLPYHPPYLRPVSAPVVPGRSPRAEPGLVNGPQVPMALANQPWVQAPSLWLVSDTHCPSQACCPSGGQAWPHLAFVCF